MSDQSPPVPTPPPLDFNSLVASLGRAAGEMEGLRDQLAAANRKSASAKNVALIGIAVGVLGVAVGAGGLVYADNAHETADAVAEIQDRIIADRTEARIVSCIQQNVTTERTRNALVAGVSALAPENGAAPERLVAFIAQYTEAVEKALPYRRCDPKGIEAYFATPPGDPAREG